MVQKTQGVKSHRLTPTLIILVGIIAMSLGFTFATRLNNSSNSITDNNDLQATLLQTPRQVSPFELINNKNMAFTHENLVGNWTMMFFGYTNCPDICPVIMADLKNMDSILHQSNAKALPQVVMVSVDPERDTPTALDQYVQLFNENFIGATANLEQIDQLAQELGIAYMKVVQDHDQHHGAMEDNYQVDHSGTIVLFNPAGNLAGYFTMPFDGETLAHDFQAITR